LYLGGGFSSTLMSIPFGSRYVNYNTHSFLWLCLCLCFLCKLWFSWLVSVNKVLAPIMSYPMSPSSINFIMARTTSQGCTRSWPYLNFSLWYRFAEAPPCQHILRMMFASVVPTESFERRTEDIDPIATKSSFSAYFGRWDVLQRRCLPVYRQTKTRINNSVRRPSYSRSFGQQRKRRTSFVFSEPTLWIIVAGNRNLSSLII